MKNNLVQEMDEIVTFQKLKKRNKGKELEKETRKPWRKIQKQKEKSKYASLQFNYNEVNV